MGKQPPHARRQVADLGYINATDVAKARVWGAGVPSGAMPRLTRTPARTRQIKAGGDGFGLKLYDPVRTLLAAAAAAALLRRRRTPAS
jgi:hypothetical protein